MPRSVALIISELSLTLPQLTGPRFDRPKRPARFRPTASAEFLLALRLDELNDNTLGAQGIGGIVDREDCRLNL